MEPQHTITIYPAMPGLDVVNIIGTHFATDDNGHLWVYDGKRVKAFAPNGAYLCAISNLEGSGNEQ